MKAQPSGGIDYLHSYHSSRPRVDWNRCGQAAVAALLDYHRLDPYGLKKPIYDEKDGRRHWGFDEQRKGAPENMGGGQAIYRSRLAGHSYHGHGQAWRSSRDRSLGCDLPNRRLQRALGEYQEHHHGARGALLTRVQVLVYATALPPLRRLRSPARSPRGGGRGDAQVLLGWGRLGSTVRHNCS